MPKTLDERINNLYEQAVALKLEDSDKDSEIGKQQETRWTKVMTEALLLTQEKEAIARDGLTGSI